MNIQKKTTNVASLVVLLLTIATIILHCVPAHASNDETRKTERQSARESQRPSNRVNKLRSLSSADEAFTESYQKILVASADDGIVSRVKVKRGDIVAVSDLLFELDMSVLEASRRLSRAKANMKAKLRSAEVQFATNTKRFEQKVELLNENAGSPEEVQRAKTEAEISKQNVEAILEEAEQFRLETQRIESQMEQKRVRSPINGVVTDVRKKVGEYVSINDPHVVTIEQLDSLRVVFYLPTERAIKIKIGDTADILLTDEQQHAKAIVEYVAPVTNADSGRVRVEVAIENELGQFRSGVRCRMLETFSQQSAFPGFLETR